ncbi:glycosyl transferase family protein [Sphingobium chlorophenolicum L-1]|uniref:Glycosyl transferase family protein n=2 Tax=Sphingobium chlorophenolicum TaxID=46429 RepID=F6F0S0_SPHCR|nr:glycosyl transferase family protein [Sphingobium chlorophenolicum L-1]
MAPVEGKGGRDGIWLAASIAFILSAVVLFLNLSKPITDQHGFRQTQTALSVYWMLHGGPWLDYQTPALGYPWSIPFEFPLYQWIVATLVRLSGLPVDSAGRIVSYAWLLLGLPPARALFRSYGFLDSTFLVYTTLLLVSPLYLFAGRAFLIETQALALSVWMLALTRQFTERPHAGTALFALVAASAAGLTKLTTLPHFLLLSGLMIAQALWRRRDNPRQLTTILAGSAAIFLPALAITFAWTRHADMLKEANPLAKNLRSNAAGMMQWNFGSLEQRFSSDLVHAVLRTTADVAGPACIVLLPFLIGLLLLQKGPGWRKAQAALLMVAAFLLPFGIFTNLYIVHNYYPSANGVFLIAALALILTGLGARFGQRVMILLLATILSSQFIQFTLAFLPNMLHPSDKEIAIADYIRDHTPRDSAIVIVGLDWSPIVPYYSTRRALMIPAWEDLSVNERLRAIDDGVGGLTIGAIIICHLSVNSDSSFQNLFNAQIRGRAHERIRGCDIYK